MVGDALRKLRRSVRGWPDKRLAQAIGISVNHLRMIERNNYACSERVIIAVVEALGREDAREYLLKLREWNLRVMKHLPAEAVMLKPLLESLGKLYAENKLTPAMARQLHTTVAGDQATNQSDIIIPTSMLQAGSLIRITVEPPKEESNA